MSAASESASASKRSGEDDFEGDRDDKPGNAKRRKARPKVSCIPCQRRKTKCDQQDPCNQCEKRNDGDNCTWDPPPLTGPPPTDFALQFGALQRRVTLLERQFTDFKKESTEARPPSRQPNPSVPSPSSLSQAGPPGHTLFTPFSGQSMTMSLPAMSPPLAINSSADKVEAETEDAARALEELALPVSSRLGQLNTKPSASSPLGQASLPGDSPASVHQQQGALTSILLGPGQKTSPALFQHLPHPEVSRCLLDHFFNHDLYWIYLCLHRPTFITEARELEQCVRNRDTDRVDPAFLAVYYMVLTWAVSSIGPVAARSISQHISLAELKARDDVWLDCFESALQASGWAEKPQARVVQALLLKLTYARTPPHGIYLGLETPSFFVHLGSATRICQLLGFHRLGSDPHTMPRDVSGGAGDPAWPAQPCSLKREMAKRLWWYVTSMDWLFVTRTGMGQIPINSFDTDLPSNVDDDDLGLHVVVQERPEEYLTDSSFARMKCGIALDTYEQYREPPHTGNIPYDEILRIGRRMKELLKRYELYQVDSNPRRRRYHRALLLMPQHNRIMRLHRPYFMRGWTDPAYAESTREAYDSSAAICKAIGEDIRVDDGNLEHAWWLWAYSLSAVFIICATLLREEKRGPSAKTVEMRKLLLLARQFYARGAQGDASATVREISIQACEVLDQMTGQASSKPSQHSAPSAVAAIFLKIASLVQPPAPASEPTPSHAHVPLPDLPRSSSSNSVNASGYSDPLSGALSSLFSLTPFNYTLSSEQPHSAPYTTTNLTDIPLPTHFHHFAHHGEATLTHPHQANSPLSYMQSSPGSHHHQQQQQQQMSGTGGGGGNSGQMLGLDLLALSSSHSSQRPQGQPHPHGGGQAGSQSGGALFDEQNHAAREFLASFAHPIQTPGPSGPNGSAGPSRGGSAGGGGNAGGQRGAGGSGPTAMEWDLSELVGPEWL